MDALPNDIQQYICGKVDKIEHISTLIEKMTGKELAALSLRVDIIIDRRREEAYNTLRQEWLSVKEGDKKMYVRFEYYRGSSGAGKDIVVEVKDIARGFLYSRSPLGRIREVEQYSSYYIE